MTRTVHSLLAGTIAVTALACSGGQIIWQESIEDALELSARTRKPVLLYFTYDG